MGTKMSKKKLAAKRRKHLIPRAIAKLIAKWEPPPYRGFDFVNSGGPK